MQYTLHHPRAGTSTIHVFSMMNDFVGYEFTVDSRDEGKAVKALSAAYDAWWDDDHGFTLYEELCIALDASGLLFEAVCNDTGEED